MSINKATINVKTVQYFFVVLLFFTGSNLLKSISFVIIDVLLVVSMALIAMCGKIDLSRFKSSSVVVPILVTIYFFLLHLSTLLNGGATVNETVKPISVVLFTWFVYLYIDMEVLKKIPSLYSSYMYYLSVVAIVSLILLIVFDTSPIYTFSFAGESRSYDNYYGTWLIRIGESYPTYISGLDFDLYRLQAWYEEPGTFGFLLLPAIVFFLVEKAWKKFSLLCISLLLSMSFGAVAALLLALVIIRARVVITLFILCVFLITFMNLDLFADAIWNYVQRKLGVVNHLDAGHSLRYRVDLVGSVLNYFTSVPLWGTGLSYHEYFQQIGMHSRSIFTRLVAGGVVGSIIIATIHILMSFFILKAFFSIRDKQSYFYGSFVLFLIVMGLQRASFFDTYFYLCIVILSALYLMRRNQQFERRSRKFS